MSEVFINLFNMSITAGWIILAVLLVRFLFRKSPAWINCVLWGIVSLRLVFPFSFKSILSLIPSTQTVGQDIMFDNSPTINSGVSSIDNLINPVITKTFAPQPIASANPLQILIPIISNLWLLGVIIMLLYLLISYFSLSRKVKVSIKFKDNIYFCDSIDSPFILGMFKPKIYIPSGIDEDKMSYIVKHEQAHLKRKDHFIKPFGFLLLSVYWFNPLIWVGYILLCRDIERACDEKVIKQLDTNGIKEYSTTLVLCSVPRRLIAACPLAFGEVGVKERVKSILNYKKPAFWIIVASLVACVVMSVCFLTNPYQDDFTILKKQTQWWCSNYNASFYVDENNEINGIINTENQEIDFEININSDKASVINTLTNEVIIKANVKEKNGNLVLDVKEDKIGLNTKELVFINSTVSVQGITTDSLFVLFGDKAMVFKQAIDNAEWLDGTSDCMSEYKITYSEGENTLVLYYHSDCGTFNNIKTKQSFTVPQEYKTAIDAILFEHHEYFSEEQPLKTLESAISSAVINKNKSDKPTGLICVESHVIVANAKSTPLINGSSTQEYAYIISLYQEYSVGKDMSKLVKEVFVPIELKFEINENGEYSLQAYNVMTSNEQIENTFPGDSVYDAVNKTEFLGTLRNKNIEKVKERYNSIFVKEGHNLTLYETYVSYANYTSDNRIYMGLNANKMYQSAINHLPIFKFETLEELNNFKSEFKDVLAMDSTYDEMPSFNGVTAHCDEEFFKEKTLFLVYVSTGSGSFRYGVNSVYNDGKSFCVHIETTNNPEVCTADMSGWFVTVGVDKELVKNCTEFDADLNNF